MLQTAPKTDRPAEKVVEFPKPARDSEFSDFTLPSSPRDRSRLRTDLEREVAASMLEHDVLERFSDPKEIPTTVKAVTEILLKRAKAMNPIRDMDKVGFSAFNKGVNPWKGFLAMEEPPFALFYGIVVPMMTGAIVSSFASPSVTAAAVVFSIAPLFLSMWGARTAFNTIAGIAAAAAFLPAYAAARVADLTVRKGLVNAKTFLADLSEARLPDDEKAELREKRVSLLEQTVEKQEKVLAILESSASRPYRVRNGDRERLTERYLDDRWFTGTRS